VKHKTRILDIDLRAFFDTICHHLVLEKVARRVEDTAVLHLLKLILTAAGKKGVAQGGPLSPISARISMTVLW
jgi:RNA-directed DNA polymerase